MATLWFWVVAAVGMSILILFGGFRWRWWVKGMLAIAAPLAIVVLALIAKPTTLGPPTFFSFFNQSPVREFALFTIMILGMMARMLSLAIEERRAKLAKAIEGAPDQKLRIDKWEFVYPMLFAVPTFGALLAQLQTEFLSIPAVALAFQNGFFWQTLLKRKLDES